MPTVLRRTGPDFVLNGKTIEPRREVHFCEVCGYENAGAIFWPKGGKLLSFCGSVNGNPACVGKGRAAA